MTQLETLFPGPRRLILRALFSSPDTWRSLAELSGPLGMSPASLRRHLLVLCNAGFVRTNAETGKLRFQPNPDCPVFAELHSIIVKLAGQSQGRETILVVEDQPATACITRILLESWGYRVIEAGSARGALDLFDSHSGSVQLLLADVVLPGMQGPELAALLRARNPSLRVVFMSGYQAPLVEEGRAAFLPKPFSPSSLSRVVRRELDRAAGLLRHAS